MKVHIDARYAARGKTGKGKFSARLAKALKGMDVKVVDSVQPCDIALHVGRIHVKSKAKKNILRVGPACVSTHMNYRKINAEKWQSVKHADGVIYQSEYSKDVYRHFVGKFRGPQTVIINGAEQAYFQSFRSHESTYQYNLLASTRVWLPQKRLKHIVKAFYLLDNKDVCLWVAGDISGTKYDKVGSRDKRIKFVGPVGQERLARLLNLCDAMVHITWLDACPNSVVEAMCAMCPVIHNNLGGTHEIVKHGHGEIGVIDKVFKFKPVNLLKPPSIDHEMLAKAMVRWTYNREIEYLKWAGIFTCLGVTYGCAPYDIHQVAKRYVEFFERCLK